MKSLALFRGKKVNNIAVYIRKNVEYNAYKLLESAKASVPRNRNESRNKVRGWDKVK